MTGDIGIHEQVIVGGAGVRDVSGLAAAIVEGSGRVTHQYGSRVLVAALPPDAAQAIERQAPEATVTPEARAISEATTGGLDEVEALGLEAFALRQSEEYVLAKAQRPLAGAAWDSGEATPPDDLDSEGLESAVTTTLAVEAGAPTSTRLTGKVAVGLVIVAGVRADLDFTATERVKVVAEVQNGLSWLGSQGSPGGISWIYDLRVITLEVEPNPNDTTREQKEARWRDPALAQLGFDPGLAGVRAYIDQLRATRNSDWAYCGFFTKYPLGWFAYASIGGPRLVMQYANDGWGPDNIDRVFAHETGHIFGAPDEYASSGCDCGGQWGFCRKPNGNCSNCATGGGVPCIMKSNSWEMCGYTPFHLGFDIPSTVPFVRETLQAHAAQAVRDVCLEPRFTGSTGPGAWVWSQSPSAGTKLARGGTVTMQLRTGPIP
jgi:hypothetical protein